MEFEGDYEEYGDEDGDESTVASETWSRLSESTFLRDVTLSYLTHWTKTHRDNLPCFVRTIQRSGTMG
jgi:hypothetical protein